MSLKLLIGAISAREDSGAEYNPRDSGADENKYQGENLAQQVVPPPVFSKRLSEVLQARGRNPATETARVIFGSRLSRVSGDTRACQSEHTNWRVS